MPFSPLKESGEKSAFGGHAPAGLGLYDVSPLMWGHIYLILPFLRTRLFSYMI